MKANPVNHTSAVDQSRREALKRFGRYAAAAPTAMVLLEPRESHAGKGNGRAKGNSKGRGGGKGGRRWGGGGDSTY
jgi:hypothetical protein